jgi:hypothetical protein
MDGAGGSIRENHREQGAIASSPLAFRAIIPTAKKQKSKMKATSCVS